MKYLLLTIVSPILFLSVANATMTKVPTEEFSIMTLRWIDNGFPVQQQVKIHPGICEYYKFEAEHNLQNIEVKCQTYVNL